MATVCESCGRTDVPVREYDVPCECPFCIDRGLTLVTRFVLCADCTHVEVSR